LDPAEFAEVQAANAMLRRFTDGSLYQRLHQTFRLLVRHAERARSRAARIPQPSLQRDTARIDRAGRATLVAADALLGGLVDDIVTDYGQQSQQAVTMREAVDQARGSLVVALCGPLLAAASTESGLVEMRDVSSDSHPDGEDGAEGSGPTWEPVLRESVVTKLVAAVGPTAAPLTEAPVMIVPLLQKLVLACQRLFARYLLLQEDRIDAASLRLRRLAAEVLDGAPALALRRGDPARPQIQLRELALGEVGVLQRALRATRRLLTPPATQATTPPTASPEGPAPATPSTAEVTAEATDHPPTDEDASLGGREAGGTSTSSAVDLLAVVEHASRLTVTAERAWSAALDPAVLGEANRELLDQWANLVAVIQRQAGMSSRALEAAGLDTTADQFPPGMRQLLTLEFDPDPERRRRQLQLAQFYALDQLVTALQALQHPSKVAMNPQTGQVTQAWWDAGAFASVSARARHLARVTLALLDAEQAAIAAAAGEAATIPGQVRPPTQPPPWWAHLDLGAEALRRGDIEATLLHAHLALTARFTDVPSLTDAVATPFGDEAEGEAVKTLVARLEEAIGRLAAGAGVDLGVSVPLAHALLPLIERLLLPVPMTSIPQPEAADDLGAATPPDPPSDTDPTATQAGK
jgi:hypothetical protein